MRMNHQLQMNLPEDQVMGVEETQPDSSSKTNKSLEEILWQEN